MPKRFVLPKSIYYPLAAIFLFCALAGVVITWQAQFENYRFGLAIDQISRLLTRAKEMNVRPDADPLAARRALVDTFAAYPGQEKVLVQDATGGAGPSLWGLLNPWGEALIVTFYPGASAVRFEMKADRDVCRRILDFYAKNPSSAGLLRMDVLRNSAYGLWTPFYEKDKLPPGRDHPAREACGNGEDPTVSLSFSLR